MIHEAFNWRCGFDFSPHFSLPFRSRVRRLWIPGAREDQRVEAHLNSTLSTAIERNEVNAGLSRAAVGRGVRNAD